MKERATTQSKARMPLDPPQRVPLLRKGSKATNSLGGLRKAGRGDSGKTGKGTKKTVGVNQEERPLFLILILLAGLTNDIEHEGIDRTVLTWPGVQEQMILNTAQCATGPVILVVFGGGPIDLTAVRDSKLISAILV